jgi:hypothetical protein
MRTNRWIAALVGLLVLAAPAWAQHSVSSGGADPTKVVNQPVSLPQTLESLGSRLSDLLPHVSLPSVGSLFGTKPSHAAKHPKKPPRPQPQRPS